MAWLKVDTTTPEKPEVLGITVALGWDDPDLVVGKLIRVWRWFDQHTVDGNAISVTPALLDRIAGVPGMTAAMESVGWLIATDTGLTLPNFDRHNGETAKKRAETAVRVAKHRSKGVSQAIQAGQVSKPTTVDGDEKRACNAEDVTEALARVRVRVREEELHTHTALARDWALPKAWGLWAIGEFPHWSEENVMAIACQFSDHQHAKAATSADWEASWRKWCRDELTQRAYQAPKAKTTERLPSAAPAPANTVPFNDPRAGEHFANLDERTVTATKPPAAVLALRSRATQ